MSDLERIVKSDLRRLQRNWGRENPIEEDDLRVDSGILRKLLVDGGTGLLPRYWRELGNKGQIKVTGVDMRPLVEGLDPALVQLASAGGATHGGMTVESALVYGAVLDDNAVAARAARGGPSKRTTTLTTYLDSSCLLVDGVWVSRRTVIQFVANRLGGVHYDEGRGHAREQIARQFAVLDTGLEYGVAGHRAVYFELLGIGQAVVASDAVQQILDGHDTTRS